jgi:hypothetical protein
LSGEEIKLLLKTVGEDFPRESNEDSFSRWGPTAVCVEEDCEGPVLDDTPLVTSVPRDWYKRWKKLWSSSAVRTLTSTAVS